jgi:hypothetical protein
MAVMARTLGIPSRIAVGYRAGANREDGQYTVSNRQLHSWPELYIRGAGWVSFEPTPDSDQAAQPKPSATATPSAAASETPLPAPGETTPPSASASATPTPTSAAAGGGSTGGGSVPWGALVAVLAALAVLGAPGVLRASRRHRRLGAVAAGRQPAVTAWRELLDDVADHGFAPGSAPPGDAAAVARTARAVLGRLASSVPGSVLPHLRSVVDAVDQERFAADGRADTGALLRSVQEARAALDAAVSRGRVVRSRLLPPSLLPSGRLSGRPAAAAG